MARNSSTSKGQSDAAGDDAQQDAEIREKAREITAQVLSGSRVDAEGVKEVVRAITPGMESGTGEQPADVRQALAEALQGLDESLMESAQAAHLALQQLGSKGTEFTENDLKEALTKLRQLQEAYVATVSKVSNAASGNIQRELRELADHVQGVSVDVGAQVASVMSEFASRLGAASSEGTSSGLDAMRDVGVRTTSLASGMLAGIADALRAQSATDKNK